MREAAVLKGFEALQHLFGTVCVACLSLHQGCLLAWCFCVGVFALIWIDLKSLPAIVVSHPHCLLSSRPSSPLFPHQGSQELREDAQEGGSLSLCVCERDREREQEPCPDKPWPDWYWWWAGEAWAACDNSKRNRQIKRPTKGRIGGFSCKKENKSPFLKKIKSGIKQGSGAWVHVSSTDTEHQHVLQKWVKGSFGLLYLGT